MDLTVGNDNMVREYRKGNWSLQETMVLIEAKKMDNQRRMRRSKPTELRWKWVEDYCWKNGCLRSQNQCNDKWDNLMRDFKKVREYESTVGDPTAHNSYWRLQKNDKKHHTLPSNMMLQIYQALLDAVDHKPRPHTPIPIPVTQPQTQQEPPALPFSQPLHCLDSDTSENTESSAKRRKKSKSGEGEGTSGGNEVGSAISRIEEAIRWSVVREERRHRELMSLQQKRLQIEESKAEINRQGINGLVDAINKLASSFTNHQTLSK